MPTMRPAIGSVAQRIRSEFLATADLRLTPWQAGRLWDLDTTESVEVLSALVDAGFLREARDGCFVRRD